MNGNKYSRCVMNPLHRGTPAAQEATQQAFTIRAATVALPNIRSCKGIFFRAVALAAGTLGICGAAGAQNRLRVGVSVSVPIRTHPMSQGDKGTITGILIVVGGLVAVAVAVACLVCLYCLLADAWERGRKMLTAWHWRDEDLTHYLPPQKARPSNPKQRKIEIEQARIRKREWEERTAQARRENAERETCKIIEGQGAGSQTDFCP